MATSAPPAGKGIVGRAMRCSFFSKFQSWENHTMVIMSQL